MQLSRFKSFLFTALCAATPARAAEQAISDTPLQSTRAASMGGVIPTVADDKDAVFENPAGIGGTRWGKASTPWVKKLYFPFASVTADKDSASLIKELRSQGAITDRSVGKSIVDANAGERQYARLNAGLGLVIGRIIVLPYYDAQVAATPRGDNLIGFREVATSGVAYGTSFTDPGETLSLGYSGYMASRSDLSGDFLYDDIINKEARSKLMRDNTTKSSAIGHNIGVTWRPAKRFRPALAVVLKNAGNTHFKVSKGSGDPATIKQDLTTALSVSPAFGKANEFNLSLAADRLLDSSVAFVKKYHVGAEVSLFGIGSYASLALRGGLSGAGGSGGLMVNLGLVGFEAGVNAVDIGTGSERTFVHRRVGTLFVNVADF